MADIGTKIERWINKFYLDYPEFVRKVFLKIHDIFSVCNHSNIPLLYAVNFYWTLLDSCVIFHFIIYKL